MASLVPMVVKRSENGERSMDIYSLMLDYRIIYLTGTVTQEQADIVIAQLHYLDQLDPTKEITINIQSNGGSVTAGLAMYDAMKTISAPIKTVAIGMVASMGSFLAACGGSKGRRFILENAEHMCHQPLISGGLSGQQTEIEIAANHMKHTRERLERLYAKHTGFSYEQIHEWCERDNYMFADKAVERGFADHIVKNLDK